jgi:hypothetical protein
MVRWLDSGFNTFINRTKVRGIKPFANNKTFASSPLVVLITSILIILKQFTRTDRAALALYTAFLQEVSDSRRTMVISLSLISSVIANSAATTRKSIIRRISEAKSYGNDVANRTGNRGNKVPSNSQIRQTAPMISSPVFFRPTAAFGVFPRLQRLFSLVFD